MRNHIEIFDIFKILLFKIFMYLRSVFSPFLGFFFALVCGRWLGARGAGVLTVLGLATSAILSVFLWVEVCAQGSSVLVPLGSWFHVSTLDMRWGFYFDPLAVVMMLTVTWVSCGVHLYSMGYMQGDPHLPRFMAYLSLFTGFMRILVTSTDSLMMLVGWEGIGVSSFLLIGFWFTRLSATKSAQKAVRVNRVSDTCLVVGIVLMWWYLGSSDFAVLQACTSVSYYNDWICYCLFLGAMGKSAQIGLHIWLADAMEGPTPVSALIHAATLVTAGVYLIARTSLLWEASESARLFVILVGSVTSLMAATCGFFQNDIKRVIAYSTCSQLGYMMVSCGASQYGLAIYHLMTHACFKALRFLSAGALIHAVSDVQDVRRHGGLHERMPWTWTVMTLGSLSLAGWPFLAGFYSKDAILEFLWSHPSGMGTFAYYCLMLVAAFTSYYTFRLVVCSFMSPVSARRAELGHAGVPFAMAFPRFVLSLGSIGVGYLLVDMTIGMGSDFWNGAIAFAPSTGEGIQAHFLPSKVALLPLLATTTGMVLAAGWSWPLPWVISVRPLYTFFLTRWQFDFVANQQISKRVLNAGSHTWFMLDKGILEVLGPKGLSAFLLNRAVPATRMWQTGTVHDYALMLKIVAILGFFVLALPGSLIPVQYMVFEPRILALGIFMVLVML